ncbi:MAG: UDP-N-acetylmuramoyl-L-alanyl-D-glutamate--2,6-diaminopimelate ligase [Tidjanibacter sp.]|nr:UDP-N-acetylmuramoyl-L-alanyl-D-glutamate--2,6-diaminopimelate ligase [Tidjanibacter sp.]
MTINELLNGCEQIECRGDMTTQTCGVVFDSRAVKQGDTFFAVRGTTSDGHDYIKSAIGKGATAIVCEELPTECADGVCWVQVTNSEKALATAAANFYDNPSRKLKLVGVTGTNGKTTIATLLYELFEKLGYKCGLISTVVYKIHDRDIISTHTTPDSVRLNAMLAEMVEIGCEYCFMEVSSHSIVQHRIGNIHFTGAVFTNLTHDHLDYHKTFAEYIKAKKGLFDALPKESFALVNADDKNGSVMLQNTKARGYEYSLRGCGDYNAKLLEMTFEGMLLELDDAQIWVRLLGRFNAYNLLAIYATARLLGADKQEVLTTMSMLQPVNGRFQHCTSTNGVTAIIDYAHTPDALANVLDTINAMDCSGKVSVVVGCGGDRDRTKRPEMAAIAIEKADRAIFTSDNPRTESPDAIINDMLEGVKGHTNYLAITDRKQAIRTAVMTASKGDIILIAGKGHEDYQIIGKEKLHFSDKEVVTSLFKEME